MAKRTPVCRSLEVLALLCFTGAANSAGISGQSATTVIGVHQPQVTIPNGPGSTANILPPAFEFTAKQKWNGDRQRRLVNDTDRLVALTSRLKAEVTNSGAETMTPEMLRQMDEIEKLARSVKEKMRD